MGLKSGKGCWTCKARKIGCDKSLPACDNCARTGRSCSGYGAKLSWPREHNRRATYAQVVSKNPHPRRNSAWPEYFEFLNTGYGDLILHQQRNHPCDFESGTVSLITPPGPKYNFPSLYQVSGDGTDASLLSYYEAVLARMITTIDNEANGFRHELLPMALTNPSLFSTTALRHAIMALAAYHLHGPESAVKHRMKAVRALGIALTENAAEHDLSARITQLAASMMLCVYGVFDTTEGKWQVHLDGARRIAALLPHDTSSTAGLSVMRFLGSWFLYHDVLSSFSAPNDEVDQARTPLMISLDDDDDSKRVIVGSLGCSVELMEIISSINQYSVSRSHISSKNSHLFENASRTILRLQTLRQLLPSNLQSSNPSTSPTRVLRTAELYRLGALIYIHRAVLDTPRQSAIFQDLISQSLEVLGALRICTSPWPLFLIASEVGHDDVRRVAILGILETMEQERRIGNIGYVRRIVEAVWKLEDLSIDEGDESRRVDWRMVVAGGKDFGLPSFI